MGALTADEIALITDVRAGRFPGLVALGRSYKRTQEACPTCRNHQNLIPVALYTYVKAVQGKKEFRDLIAEIYGKGRNPDVRGLKGA